MNEIDLKTFKIGLVFPIKGVCPQVYSGPWMQCTDIPVADAVPV